MSNRRNRTLPLSVLDRAVLGLLDGSRDQAAIVEVLTQRVLAGEFGLERDGQPLTDPDAIRAAITPRTRVILMCHVINLTGQILPVRDVVRMARPKGIPVIVDGAHSFAHFPFTQADLDCDYYGTSLHKWLLAPIGTGFLYVRRERIAGHWALQPPPASLATSIRKFEEIGTHPAANHNAIAEALVFHHGIGAERKAARLRYLKERWATQLKALPKIRLHTSLDPALSCAIGTVGIEGVDGAAITSKLWEQRIIVTPIKHAEYQGVRVTPNVYTTLQEVDMFADAKRFKKSMGR